MLRKEAESYNLEAVCRVFYQRLKMQPLDYRHYGPWWWAVKSVMNAQGFFIGDEMDVQRRHEFSTGEPLLDLVAADLVRKDRLMNAIYLNPDYLVDETEYRLFDTDMESKI